MPSATPYDCCARKSRWAIGPLLYCLLAALGGSVPDELVLDSQRWPSKGAIAALAGAHKGFDYASANELYDFKMPPFQQWLRENHYLRQPSEGDTDFCCRVYLARAAGIRKGCG